MAAFAPARSLYSKLGFVPCEPFRDYTANRHSVCMTIDLS
jgi:putative acetyltransferase